MENELKKRVRLIKALQNVSYTELASYLDIKRNSFYNWLKGYYSLSLDK